MKKYKTVEVLITITFIVIKRILAFPFFCGIAFIGALSMFLTWIINFIRFGGESIAYTDKMNRKTIQDIFLKLIEIQNNDKE